MTQILTLVSFLAAGAYLVWRYRPRLAPRRGLRIRLHLDRPAPGAHVMWDLVNAGPTPITLTKLIVHGRHGANDTVPLGLPRRLEPQDEVVLPTDVDWSLLAARSLAAADADDREYAAPRRELARIQDQLRGLIERRESTTSAREFLFGAADLAFGVMILGLGFFMLMWVIATG